MSTLETFEPGALVDGRFRIVRLLGRGGMGEVYEAEDLELREQVALKVVHGLWRSDPDRIERFRREVHLGRKVTHPNVCRAFDVFRHQAENEQIAFVTMELLEGETLDQHLRRSGRLSTDEALPLVTQMAAALDAAHAAGVIHRDFKAGNVMLVPRADGELRAVVTDFGLAQSGEEPALGGAEDEALVGSAATMAPEQIRGEGATAATDVYALGVVLYEMVTGTRPFRDWNVARLLARRLQEPAPAPRAVVPDLDPRWNDAILRCLALDPAERFARPAELVSALLPPKPRAEPGLRWPWALLAAVLFLSCVGGIVAILVAPRGAGAPKPPFATFDPLQLTTAPGLEVDPAFSPGGEALAFSSDETGSFELRLRELGPGGGERPLTADGKENVQPTWSPDGRRLAYYSEGRGGIWVMKRTGGEPRELTDFGSQPSWSPDGSRIVFQSQGKIEISAGSAPALPPSTIWIIDLDAGATHPVTEAGTPPGGHGVPVWSPEGDRIFFSTYYSRRSEIWSVRPDGSDLVPAVRDVPAAFHPVFTPDGTFLLYSAVAEGERYGMWSLPFSSRTGQVEGAPHLLANLGWVSIRQLAISPDGSRLAYVALATSSNLWSVLADPGTGVALAAPSPLTSGTGRNNRPAFSPDGRRLAFDRWRIGVNRDLWELSLERESLTQLTSDRANDTQASYFPEGDRIAYLSERDGSWSLWSLEPGTGRSRRILDLDTEADSVRLSPDGSRIAFHSRRGGEAINVWVADLDGGDPVRVTDDPELAGFPAWAPDGHRLAYEIRRGEDTQVMTVDLDTGETRQLTDEPGHSWPYSWSPDGRRIAFAGLRDGFWNIYWIDAQSGEVEPLTRFHRRNCYTRYPAWSPRGDRVLFELAETTGDIWIVEDTP